MKPAWDMKLVTIICYTSTLTLWLLDGDFMSNPSINKLKLVSFLMRKRRKRNMSLTPITCNRTIRRDATYDSK